LILSVNSVLSVAACVLVFLKRALRITGTKEMR